MNVLELFQWATVNNVEVQIMPKEATETEVILTRLVDGAFHHTSKTLAHHLIESARVDLIKFELDHSLRDLEEHIKSYGMIEVHYMMVENDTGGFTTGISRTATFTGKEIESKEYEKLIEGIELLEGCYWCYSMKKATPS